MSTGSTTTSTDTYDYVIVGGGLEGLAIAWGLTSRGEKSVLVIEREQLCGGMTGKSSGVVRAHYGTPSVAKMGWKGTKFFHDAPEILGDDCGFRNCGYMVAVGEENVGNLEATIAMQQGLGVDVEFIGGDKARELWPGLHVDDFAKIAYEPLGGRGDAPMLGMAFSVVARQQGAKIRQGTTVTGFTRESEADGARVTGVTLGDGSTVGAGQVILATGAWAAQLGETIGLDIPVRAQRAQLMLVDPGEPLPHVPVLSDLVSLQYLAGEPNGDILCGNSDHHDVHWADPDNYPNKADDDFIEWTIGKLMHRLPDMPNPGLTSTYAGCYDTTPDYNPIMGPSGIDGLFLAVGFSGHGFKIAPAVAEFVADLLLDGDSSDPDIPASDFRLSRFAEGDLTRSLHPYIGAGEMR
ncbi:MAG: NAD(P)/FAD-dependent oxidoreductase [Corynebacterium variabile]|uniref:NAD(P)/FAD-dependent oxidoreductase n=1 Tax=Corynebacterium variabile TaxID=1727 RepID=UPI003F93BC1A